MITVRAASAVALVFILAACATTSPPPPADSKTAAERSYDAMWGFQCASLAGHMKDPAHQKKLYDMAHQSALWVVADVRSSAISEADFRAKAPVIVQATLGDFNGDPAVMADRLSKAMEEMSDGEVTDAARAAAGTNATAAEIDAAMAPAAKELYARRVCRRFDRS
jgi:hypothetical protein